MVAIYTRRNNDSQLVEIGKIIGSEIQTDNPADRDLIYRWSLKLGSKHPTEEDWLRRYSDGTFIRAQKVNG